MLAAAVAAAMLAGCGDDDEATVAAPVTPSTTTTEAVEGPAHHPDRGQGKDAGGDGRRGEADSGAESGVPPEEARQELARRTRGLREQLLEAVENADGNPLEDPRVQELRDELLEIREQSGVPQARDENSERQGDDRQADERENGVPPGQRGGSRAAD
jgi:hypothetical protein